MKKENMENKTLDKALEEKINKKFVKFTAETILKTKDPLFWVKMCFCSIEAFLILLARGKQWRAVVQIMKWANNLMATINDIDVPLDAEQNCG